MASPDFRPEPFTDREAYLWSIEQAAFEEHRQWFNGTLYTVGRGEFVTSIHAMAKAFQWTDKRVRGFAERMSKAGKWAKRGAHEGAKAPTLLTVRNYDVFQSPKRAKGEATGEEEGNRGAKQGQSEGVEQKEGLNKGNESKEGNEGKLALAAPYQDAVSAWSEAASIKGWKPRNPDLTPKRRNELSATLKVHGLDGFIAAIQKALDSEMLGGPDPPGWFNFDFVCNLEKLTRLKDGNYDKSFSGGAARPDNGSGAWQSARSELRGFQAPAGLR